MVDALNQSQASVGGLPSYEDLEQAVLGGAAAIHSLTTERDELRRRCEAQERELTILRAKSDDLRRQLVLVGDCYVRFANSCVVQLQHVSRAMEQPDGGLAGLKRADARLEANDPSGRSIIFDA